jgi:hypothetical protein
MDADVYGPSIPTLMGAGSAPAQRTPAVSYGVKIMSMGFFVPKGEATIWRGPMLSKVVDQFLGGVDWGGLDYLLVDLPPGTGDVQLSLCQMIPYGRGHRLGPAGCRLQRHVEPSHVPEARPGLDWLNMSGFELNTGQRKRSSAARSALRQNDLLLGEILSRRRSDHLRRRRPIVDSVPDRRRPRLSGSPKSRGGGEHAPAGRRRGE